MILIIKNIATTYIPDWTPIKTNTALFLWIGGWRTMETLYNIIRTGWIIGRSIIFSTDWSSSTKTQNYYFGPTRPKSKSIRIDGIQPKDGLSIQSRSLNNINNQGIIIDFVHNIFLYLYITVPMEKVISLILWMITVCDLNQSILNQTLSGYLGITSQLMQLRYMHAVQCL